MELSFPQFALLPLELRRAVWQFAALGWTQDIHFLLSSPKEAWEDPPFDCRKHLFAFELSMPPLLYACHDSRAAALEHYQLGLNIEAKNAWSWRANRFDNNRYNECPYDGRVQEFGRKTYWIPDNDVVVLEHEIEPLTCGMQSICNSMPHRRHEYKFDQRIRYMAIAMDVWNCGSGGMMFDIPALEVLFVLVDPKPCFAFLGTAVRILGAAGAKDSITRESNLRESCRIVEGQMTETLRSDQALFRLRRGLGVQLKVEVVLVESIDELIEVVGQRRNANIRAVAKASVT
jgi:hypothetical protein